MRSATNAGAGTDRARAPDLCDGREHLAHDAPAAVDAHEAELVVEVRTEVRRFFQNGLLYS